MAENLSKHLKKFSKRGPHRVLVGELSYAGLPGKIYAPAEGNALPGVVFGHDWMKDVKNYHATLRHLASWGIVVAAPNTERGLMPNHRGFASDMESCIQILNGVRLGVGNITVAPGRIGLVGHGMGAGAAVLAACDRAKVKSVVAAFPSKVSPSAEEAAKKVTAQGMIIGTGDFALLDYGNAPALAMNWRGDVVYREMEGVAHSDVAENSHFRLLESLNRRARRREQVVALITGYVLHTLYDDRKLSAFGSRDAVAKGIESFSGAQLATKADLTQPGSLSLPF
ncbi:dienelactone hydrolase family protein [Corynebacterium felinum]|uniref:Dienelactone hydrolase n=1 Tax=Corynebacterium felinum TaxID=131318 RepID=A0ABU2BBH6_9CORY|nr:dienelactone hydrolase family protein [Corynebacterium felinum]MDF5820993.1 dienelactone hydrolase family protein [Corynebacterium felinum]MDR7354739.1 dienelactone hydrolase [Corynebacterium felinum]WJY94102.1 Alpha/beta hydrolase family protein [Corynebacterium felinum]